VTGAKVFKLKELTLAPGESVTLARTQQIRDFTTHVHHPRPPPTSTTRVHHPARHDVEIVVNGERLARTFFALTR